MYLVIDPRGGVRCVYAESIDLFGLGELSIRRASHVEPDERGKWWADLWPVNGPVLGPFDGRRAALVEEQQWLESNWLV
jgi:hypothetical protein